MEKRKKMWEETEERKKERMRNMHIRNIIILPIGFIISLFTFISGLHFIFHTHSTSYGFITFPKLELSLWWYILGVIIVNATVFYWRATFILVSQALKYLRENKKKD